MIKIGENATIDEVIEIHNKNIRKMGTELLITSVIGIIASSYLCFKSGFHQGMKNTKGDRNDD